MLASETRRQFLDFFVGRCGHSNVPSSSVVPHDDPTLLFTNAGMNQFKDVFLGRGTRPYTRAVNSQKCIRAGGKHNDLEDVGRDTYHHTFFEMLGTWSFGDYFKIDSIAWGWEFLTTVLGLPADRIYVTYFRGEPKAGLDPDQEARDIWLNFLPPSHVIPGNMKDNFWEMGDTGPCGPCSEIHFDRIGGRDASTLVNSGDPDVLEVWNHVFIQFNREAGGALKLLPARHVDTGMGFERLVSVLQDRRSNYDTDLWSPIFSAISARTRSSPYGGSLTSHADIAYRVIADHIRCLTVAITDGAAPGNEGRAYVLRRILRRAARHGHQTFGVREPFLCDLVPTVIESLGEAFPELRARPQRVIDLIRDEELAFGRTLDRGIAHFSDAAERAVGPGGAKSAGQTSGHISGHISGQISGQISSQISSDDAFRLHDTFGFPIDLTQVMASERNLTVDVEGYEALMEKARDVSRRGGETEARMALTPDALGNLRSLGIAETNTDDKYLNRPLVAEVRAIWTGSEFDERAEIGRVVGVILDRTNHYAEQGGQVGDQGRLRCEASTRGGRSLGAAEVEIQDTQNFGGYVLHIGRVSSGTLTVGDRGELFLERDRRDGIRANHTVTHLLNLALRKVVGEESDQRGSLVAADRLRFDFAANRALAPEEIERVESLVNESIAADLKVFADLASLEKARAVQGLRAVFGERYPDPVRIVSVGASPSELLTDPSNGRWRDLSIEFCGGTHLDQTGEAKRFVLLSEGALASGIRRIFGLAGPAALAAQAAGHGLEQRALAAERLSDETLPAEFDELASQIDALPMSLGTKRRVQSALERLRERVKSIRKREQGASRVVVVAQARAIAEQATTRIIVHALGAADRDALLAAMDVIRARRPDAAVMLFATDLESDKLAMVAGVPPALVAAGLKAGEWVKDAATACSGTGGGRPDMAQAGGKGVANLEATMIRAADFAKQRVPVSQGATS